MLYILNERKQMEANSRADGTVERGDNGCKAVEKSALPYSLVKQSQ